MNDGSRVKKVGVRHGWKVAGRNMMTVFHINELGVIY